MSHREESQTALLVAAEALLRAADYPACRGLPASPVSTTLLGQLAGAAASMVGSEADVPMRSPGLCGDPDCWDYRWMGGRYCFRHRELDSVALASNGEKLA